MHAHASGLTTVVRPNGGVVVCYLPGLLAPTSLTAYGTVSSSCVALLHTRDMNAVYGWLQLTSNDQSCDSEGIFDLVLPSKVRN
jgi:hypothetical protein